MAPEKEIVEVNTGFYMLFNKSTHQKYLHVKLYNEEELKILKLFLKKIKLEIKSLCIGSILARDIIKKEDFQLIQP
jgi:hypothetical protein